MLKETNNRIDTLRQQTRYQLEYQMITEPLNLKGIQLCEAIVLYSSIIFIFVGLMTEEQTEEKIEEIEKKEVEYIDMEKKEIERQEIERRVQ